MIVYGKTSLGPSTDAKQSARTPLDTIQADPGGRDLRPNLLGSSADDTPDGILATSRRVGGWRSAIVGRPDP
jgi:hypothetical protein